MAQNTASKPENFATEDWVVELLASHHTRNEFDCGVPDMNLYLREHASQNAKKDIARTFVAVQPAAPARIGGYYSLTVKSLALDAMPREKQRLKRPLAGIS